MKVFIVAVAALCLFCSSAFADEYCDYQYGKYVKGLEKTTKIFKSAKAKYLTSLNKAYQLCKEGQMEDASIVMKDLKNEFFREALLNQRMFFGN